MKGFSYPQTIFKPLQNDYLIDSDILETLDQLKIKQYTDLETEDNQLILKFTFKGDQFLSLQDLITFKENDLQCFQVDYAFVIINQILAEFQSKYEKYQLNVNFNPEEIWIHIGQSQNSFQQVIFTSINFDKLNKINPDIGQLKTTIVKFLQLFSQSDPYIIQEVNETLKKCNQINEIQNIIQNKLKPSQQLMLNHKSNIEFQKLVDIFQNSKEISLQGKNYDILTNNLISQVAKSNYSLKDASNIQRAFEILNLLPLYKILTLWDDLDDIFIILKEYEILNSLKRLQNINDYIFLLTFPKQRHKPDIIISVSYAESTLKWIEFLEKFINYKINHYIKNILDFYKGDKDEWFKVDYKCIFNKIRQQYNDSENVEQTIENYQSLKDFTYDNMKIYYQEKVNGLNQEIIKIMFKKK
ncbi:unnamed protein product (macronuclear) [Paramecium tetraurelia]|uniref:Uncharacterized protein n=1 Tax=Paramecium tetraurelia TaxID=5888 RepID=A0DRQ0_PARTE|nr:uncharacterized protein GSPATT00019435001 [Paramecium tetraurelia]CAK85717.1 unnamed protein product [Paramecium tetraurelia]|eukprot:XP_001453114.1 hypothetical protein (macronuclear) [Paramecium tetraurelia strain d4-2]